MIIAIMCKLVKPTRFFMMAMIFLCHNIQAQLSDMEQGGILYYELDENGERKFVSDERVEAKKNKLRDYLKKNCGGV